ncbi:MAG: hypothetical protein HOC71_12670, partial [Candidatus Latescibacteria bacterium]|nr:hypothetical protein [Candidatus Latescibacterota bacterium]
VNLRAEVFVNRKLVGYDVIGNVPFEIDATSAVNFGGENRLDIRVTDPVGNFDWNDNVLYRWGKNEVPGVHGYGGVTGKVYVRAVDTVSVTDIYVQNKPSIKDVEIFITLDNASDSVQKGTLSFNIHEWKDPSKVVWKKNISTSVSSEGKEVSIKAKVSKAKVWDLYDPHLYVASVTFTGPDKNSVDSMNRRFGFRWFDIGEKNGDKRFYLNGKRVFIFAAMTRGFWPKNGIFPTDEMARRDVEAMHKLGFNMMLFHRAVGQHYVTELCDEEGFLTYEEPGGYRCMPEPDETSLIWRREKLSRMIIRDRSYPSMVIYNFKNEARNAPSEDDTRNVQMVHELDPSRIVTYNSDRNRTVSATTRLEKDTFKLHMKPFDDTLYYHGWWDQHHWISYAGYVDEFYNNPRFYLRGTVVRGDSLHRLEEDEIIFWGEEGAFGTQLRLQKIKEELDRTGGPTGWREMEHIDYFHNYDRFLDESGFRDAFPTVDDLTMSIGRNLHYFHGRILENVRLSNIADAYNLNGWASGHTHSDIVDAYRYPTADQSILQYYTRPLYIAVKIRDKVLPSGATPVADFFIINELNVRGKHTLEIKLQGPDGGTLFSKQFDVRVKGGEEFGQLLAEEVVLPQLNIPGYYKLNASLLKGKDIKAKGYDDIFVVDYITGAGIQGKGAVIDTTGIINTFLKEARGITFPTFDPDGPDLDYIIVGVHDFNKTGRAMYYEVMDRVVNGATLIILDQTGRWAQQMDGIYSHKAIEYHRSFHWGNRGRLFVGNSDYLSGLPQAQSMNWEYQVFYKGDVWGIGMGSRGIEPI